MSRLVAALTAAILALGLGSCATEPVAGGDARARGAGSPGEQAGEQRPAAEPLARPAEAVPTTAPPSARPSHGGGGGTERAGSDGRPRDSRLSVPAIGLRALEVVAYRGRPDDAPGTRIQDGGVAASPHGPRGGTGPGGVGNYIVTAHRTSSTRAFADLPGLRRGDRVQVVAGGTRYVYRIVRTRWTSFRSPRSLRAQAAAVPGRPGARPTRPMITLSTCATPEDHARGNYWSDEFGNPEHRIDKIGVLVATRPA